MRSSALGGGFCTGAIALSSGDAHLNAPVAGGVDLGYL